MDEWQRVCYFVYYYVQIASANDDDVSESVSGRVTKEEETKREDQAEIYG